MPQLTMQVVGKVNRRGSGSHFHHAPLRREHIHVFVFYALRTLGFNVATPGEQLTKPGHFLIFGTLGTLFRIAGFFIAPVCGHTEFVVLVHLTRTDLNFNWSVARIQNHGMQ